MISQSKVLLYHLVLCCSIQMLFKHLMNLRVLSEIVKIKVCKYLQSSCFLNDISLSLKRNRTANDLMRKIKTMIKLSK